jgi:hypothetical protein
VLRDGERIRFFSIDVAGNPETPKLSDAARVDDREPETAIDAGPDALTREARPSVAFSSPSLGESFECSLDGSAFAPCTSPWRPEAALRDGDHTFRVRALSHYGVADRSPAQATFTVDTTAPGMAELTAEPDAIGTATSATFAFTGDQDATFTCTLDDAAPAACSSPVTYTGLAVGTHRFAVVQRDRAGNVSDERVVTWAVVAPQPPAPALTSGALSLAAPKSRAGMLDWRGVPVVVGCGEIACSFQLTAKVLENGQPVYTLPSLSGTLPAGSGPKQFRIQMSSQQQLQLLLYSIDFRRDASVRYVLTATGPDGQVVTRTFDVDLPDIWF